MRQFVLIDIFGWTALYAFWFAIWPWSGAGPLILIVWSLLIAGTIDLLKFFNRRSAALFAIFSVGVFVALGIFLGLAFNPTPDNFAIIEIAVFAIIAGILAAYTLGTILWISVAIADWLITRIKRKLDPSSASK